jgi:hypothetical protein
MINGYKKLEKKIKRWVNDRFKTRRLFRIDERYTKW